MGTEKQTDVLVVGGGIAGLLAARAAWQRGLRVTLVDKAVRVGGRLATRRIGPGRGDHGAQFFTVRSPEFQALVDQWAADGLVYAWADGFSDGHSPAPSDGHPRYVTREGMNNLAKHITGQMMPDVKIESNVRLAAVTPAGDGWEALAEDGRVYTSRAVALTPPVPQALALVAQQLVTTDLEALLPLEYEPCLTGIFWVSGDVYLPEPGAIRTPDQPITWMADNRRKGVSPEAVVVTVQAGPGYSHELRTVPEREALALLKDAITPFLAAGAVVKEGQLKAWTYALPINLYPERHLLAASLPPLVFAGDAFGGPRVEGAALSGLEAGRVLAACLGA